MSCGRVHTGVGMHMHLLETPSHKEYARRRTDKTVVQHLEDLGFLGLNLTLGHRVWLSETDIAQVVESGVMICHNTNSNLRLRSGVAPVNHFLAHEARVSLGLDEAGINDDRDMLQEMRLVLRLHLAPGMDDRVPTCPEVFEGEIMAAGQGVIFRGGVM
ncbi:hypothetical protein C2W62_27205 [Candidatus Entotheonella serta]|nr:hypothetical protein C2W62_27205 [Candidatus Entotheonella serta]